MSASDDATPPADLTDRGYYYNLETGEVEQGQLSVWTDRMGPYASAEEARKALETAGRRTDDWDEADRRWREGD